MRIWAFGVTHWTEGDTQQFDMLKAWLERIDAFVVTDHVYLSLGTQSDPALCPCAVDEIVDIGLQLTKPYKEDWSYLRSGLMAGLYHALLQRDKWDILLHVQDRTLIGEDISPILTEFHEGGDLLMAPKWQSFYQPGAYPETGFMALKPEGVLHYVTQSHRASLSREPVDSTEEEFGEVLGRRWFDPWPEIETTRRRDVLHPAFDSNLIDDDTFYALPVIAGGKHCSVEQRAEWCRRHPITHARQQK